jgi:hypothetical protein
MPVGDRRFECCCEDGGDCPDGVICDDTLPCCDPDDGTVSYGAPIDAQVLDARASVAAGVGVVYAYRYTDPLVDIVASNQQGQLVCCNTVYAMDTDADIDWSGGTLQRDGCDVLLTSDAGVLTGTVEVMDAIAGPLDDCDPRHEGVAETYTPDTLAGFRWKTQGTAQTVGFGHYVHHDGTNIGQKQGVLSLYSHRSRESSYGFPLIASDIENIFVQVGRERLAGGTYRWYVRLEWSASAFGVEYTMYAEEDITAAVSGARNSVLTLGAGTATGVLGDFSGAGGAFASPPTANPDGHQCAPGSDVADRLAGTTFEAAFGGMTVTLDTDGLTAKCGDTLRGVPA